jgi:hypothetical protein
MNTEIKTLIKPKRPSPPLWTIFEDATGGLSSTRFAFILMLIVVMGVWGYLSITTAVMVVIPIEIVCMLIGFGGVKTWQRFAEGKEVEAEMNMDFMTAQLKEKNPIDNPKES